MCIVSSCPVAGPDRTDAIVTSQSPWRNMGFFVSRLALALGDPFSIRVRRDVTTSGDWAATLRSSCGSSTWVVQLTLGLK
jgi:hypothetical protein